MLLTLCIIATVVLGVHYLTVVLTRNPRYDMFTYLIAGLIVGAVLMGLPIVVTILVLYARLPTISSESCPLNRVIGCEQSAGETK